MTACVFTNADRARAILFDVIDRYRNHVGYRGEIRAVLENVSRMFRAAPVYDFSEPSVLKGTFDLSKGVYRPQLVETVFAGNQQTLETGKFGARQKPLDTQHCSPCPKKSRRGRGFTRLACLLFCRQPGTARSG
jgi:hypothetical protein